MKLCPRSLGYDSVRGNFVILGAGAGSSTSTIFTQLFCKMGTVIDVKRWART